MVHFKTKDRIKDLLSSGGTVDSQTTLIKALKTVLKTRAITYRELARELGLSESGTKKMLSAKDFPVGRLFRICEWLGISAADLVRLAEKEEVQEIQFTETQVRTLLEDPTLLRVYWRLVAEHEDTDQIQREERLSAGDIKKHLLKLERLELLKITKDNQVRLKHKGLLRWTSGNPLVDRLEQDWSELTLRRSLRDKNMSGIHRLSALQLTPLSIKDLLQRLNETVDEFARRSQREALTNHGRNLRPFSLLIAGAQQRLIDPEDPLDSAPERSLPLGAPKKTRRD
jgi:DNA-binding Xre family transcriptional regulator